MIPGGAVRNVLSLMVLPTLRPEVEPSRCDELVVRMTMPVEVLRDGDSEV